MTGRELPPTSRFAGDDGGVPAALAAALTAFERDAGALVGVVAALAGTRVLVPVLAELEASEVTAEGLQVDKEASAGVVALRTADGRAALPVFSGSAAMSAWRADARPMPAEGPRAALAALAEGWELLVLDPAGPVTAVVPRPAVHALATGADWRPAVEGERVRGDVVDAVRGRLAGLPAVRTVDAVPGRRAEVAVVLGLEPGLDRAALDALLRRAGEALAADDVVTAAVDTLELRVVAAS